MKMENGKWKIAVYFNSGNLNTQSGACRFEPAEGRKAASGGVFHVTRSALTFARPFLPLAIDKRITA